MPLAARLVFALAGLVVAFYAGASLVGRATPPWWKRDAMVSGSAIYVLDASGRPAKYVGTSVSWRYPREGRELISVAVGAVGLAAVAYAAWPRRERARPP